MLAYLLDVAPCLYEILVHSLSCHQGEHSYTQMQLSSFLSVGLVFLLLFPATASFSGLNQAESVQSCWKLLKWSC